MRKTKKLWIRIKKVFTKINFWAGVLLMILSFVFFRKNIEHLFMSPKEVLEDNNRTPLGLLIPNNIYNNGDTLKIGCGSFSYGIPLRQLQYGVKLNLPLSICKNEENPINVEFKIVYNRLLVSADIKDLRTEHFIASIIENKIIVYNEEYINSIVNDSTFTIFDKSGYTAFSYEFRNKSLNLRGYFIGTKYTSTIWRIGLTACINKLDSNYFEEVLDTAWRLK